MLQRDISDKKAPIPWNIDVIGRVAKEQFAHLNWKHVIERLDIPRFVISSEAAFNFLTGLYYKITNEQIPIEPFYNDWDNPRGQVSFLAHAIYSK